MKTKSNLFPLRFGALGMVCLVFHDQAEAGSTLPTSDGPASKRAEAISWSQIGAKAGADYQGDGLAVSPAEGGARLRCVVQRLEGQATSKGLWLSSTVRNATTSLSPRGGEGQGEGATNDRFRVTAVVVGRATSY